MNDEIFEMDSILNGMDLVEEDNNGVNEKDIEAALSMIDIEKPPCADKIMVPSALDEEKGYEGAVYGYIRPDSGYHAIVGWDTKPPVKELRAQVIGYIGAPQDAELPYVAGEYTDEGLRFRLIDADPITGERYETELRSDIYTMKQDVFSRNSGLMETSWLDQSLAFISGCGSVGSQVALQLARSGVGRFILCDTDCVEIHNVCRHQCSLADVGKYKVDAVEERIKQINPEAEVVKFYARIQDVPRERFESLIDPAKTVFIGTCDNRVGDAAACDLAYSFGCPFLALGFMTRAWAGEIFICLPERHDVCYGCAFKQQIEESIAAERRNHFYMGEEDLAKAAFEPGLDVDLEFGVSLFDKVVLDVFNRRNPEYRHRLLPTLSQFIVFSGTADRTYSNDFWNKCLPKPVSMVNISFRDECRRCSHCIIESDTDPASSEG